MPYSIDASESAVTGRSSFRLPFEPRGEARTYRDELRAAIGHLRATGHLYARYSGPKPRGPAFDLENVLFYNVGTGVFGPHAVSSLTFERGAPGEDSALPHRQLYRVQGGKWDAGPTDATALATFRAPLAGRPANAHQTWASVAAGERRVLGEAAPDGEIAVLMTVSAPIQVNLAAYAKPLLDGVLSAFHTHDGTDPDRVPSFLAERTGLSSQDAWKILTDESKGVLGTRRLLHGSNTSLGWNPADDRCAFVSIDYRYDPSWAIVGSLRRITT